MAVLEQSVVRAQLEAKMTARERKAVFFAQRDVRAWVENGVEPKTFKVVAGDDFDFARVAQLLFLDGIYIGIGNRYDPEEKAYYFKPRREGTKYPSERVAPSVKPGSSLNDIFGFGSGSGEFSEFFDQFFGSSKGSRRG